MRLSGLLAFLLALPARAQVVPIAGRVSTPVSGASAGAAQAPGSGLALAPGGSLLLPQALSLGSLQAPSVLARGALALEAAPAAALAKADAAAPASISAVSPAFSKALPAAALTPAPVAAGAALDAALAAASTEEGPGAKDEDAPKPAAEDPNGGLEDGRSLFDGAGNRPEGADGSNDLTPEEIEAAFGPRPAKTLLKNFGIAGALVAVNTVAYAAVPHVGETKTLSRLSFDSNQFLTALEDLSFSGLMESLSRGFTSMFMHANAAHIFGNMLMLALFAPWVQSALGGRRTMVIYLAGGLGAVGAHAFSAPEGLLLGASAAISALLGAALTIWSKPKDEDAFNWRMVFQAFAILVLFGQVKNLVVQGATTPEHVATLAHVVGAGVGLALGGWYALRRNLRKERSA